MNIVLLYKIREGISLFLSIINIILLGYCVMSWFAPPTNQLFQIISRFAQPIIAPFRPIAQKLNEKGLPFDASVLIALLALTLLDGVISYVFRLLMVLF